MKRVKHALIIVRNEDTVTNGAAVPDAARGIVPAVVVVETGALDHQQPLQAGAQAPLGDGKGKGIDR